MRKTFLILLPALISTTILAQPGGVVQEGHSVSSSILGEDVAYTIYLPPDYEISSRSYPVVYLLHGYSDDDTGWLQFGEVKHIADAAIASGKIPAMVIVMPDGGVSWYINSYDGATRWEDFFVEEFVPEIENTYRIRKKKEFRGISGLSMGGYGSLVLSMHHPDLFAATAAFSSGVWTDKQMAETPDEWYDTAYGMLYGRGLDDEDRLTDHWLANSVLEIAETADVDELKKVRYYIDCGDDDFLTIGNVMLHVALTEREIPHEFRMRDGAHTWSYWRTGLPDGLKFIGESFRR